jgi:hypothetical protein
MTAWDERLKTLTDAQLKGERRRHKAKIAVIQWEQWKRNPFQSPPPKAAHQ